MAAIAPFSFKNYEETMVIPCKHEETIDLPKEEVEKTAEIRELAERIAQFYGTFFNPLWHQEQTILDTFDVHPKTIYPAEYIVRRFKILLHQKLREELGSENGKCELLTSYGSAKSLNELFLAAKFPKEEMDELLPLVSGLTIKRSPESIQISWFAEKA